MDSSSAAVTTSSGAITLPFEAKYALIVNLSANPVFLRPNQSWAAVINAWVPLLYAGAYFIYSVDMAGQDKLERLKSLAAIASGGNATLAILLIS